MINIEHNNTKAKQQEASLNIADLDDEMEFEDDIEFVELQDESYTAKELLRRTIATQIEKFLLDGGSIDDIESNNRFKSGKNAQ